MPKQPYEETVTCEVRQDEGLVHIKVIAMPYQDPVEFNTSEARAFAEKILAGLSLLNRPGASELLRPLRGVHG